MRNPKRIDRILKLVKKIWKKYPHLRLGQLLDNAITYENGIFYVEDDNLEIQLKKVYLKK